MPATAQAPRWITGQHRGIAVRVSEHPTVVGLCQAYGAPASTSANRAASLPSATTTHWTRPCWSAWTPPCPARPAAWLATAIRDALTGQALRE